MSQENLNAAILSDIRGGQKDGVSQPVLAVDLTYKQSIYGFHGNRKGPFLRITMALPKYVVILVAVATRAQIFSFHSTEHAWHTCTRHPLVDFLH